jgi:HK97 gp10 family phage protein
MIMVHKIVLRYFPKEVLKAAQQASLTPLMEAGYLVQREAKKSMRKFTGKSSKPGHPPKSRTGRLKAGIHTAREKDGRVIVGPVGSAWYGKILEHGGRNVSPRPFMKPAVEKVKEKFPYLWHGKSLASTPEGRKLNAWRLSRSGS